MPSTVIDPWIYSDALRARIAEWTAKDATTDDILNIAANIAPASVINVPSDPSGNENQPAPPIIRNPDL